MNQMNKLLWAGIATSLLSGPALAADISCELSPGNSVITDGQTLQLAAQCSAALSDIDLEMKVGSSPYASVLGSALSLNNYDAGNNSIVFTSPINSAALGANEVLFKVTSDSDNVTSNVAKVVIKPATGAGVVAPTGFASSVEPVNAQCGDANGDTVPSLPSNGALCASGKPALVVSGPTSYSWSCLSLTGGAEANCYATRGVTYTVTATDNGSPDGRVDPASQPVAGGSIAYVNAFPADGYNTSWTSTCGSPQSGNTYTTSAVNANCTVTASFSRTPIPTPGACGGSNGGAFTTAPSTDLCSAGALIGSVTTGATSFTWTCAGVNGGANSPLCSATRNVSGGGDTGGDPGVGSGLWQPSGMSNRTVADIAGLPGATVGYVPGCLNGGSANAHYSGCAASPSFTGTLANTGAAHTFSFGSGRQLVLRYRSIPTAGTSGKVSLRVKSDTGSNVLPTTVRVWLSTSPTATYESVSDLCKASSSTKAYIATGPGYCPVTPDTRYYYGIEYDAASSYRFIIDQFGSDFY